MAHRVEESAEEIRQAALDRSGILDTGPDARIDRVVTMAVEFFRVSSAAVTFLDRDRQWLKSGVNIPASEGPRQYAFCDYTIRADEVFVVPSLPADPRFSDHPYVRNELGVRFYAGYPIQSREGERVGTLCIFDRKPRLLGKTERIMLRSFAHMVQDELWENYPIAV